MNKFVGTGFLVEKSSYEVKDQNGNVCGNKFKYVFIVGEVNELGFITGASLESFISDKDLLPGKLKLMDKIPVEVVIRKFREKDSTGRYVDVYRPTYTVAGE